MTPRATKPQKRTIESQPNADRPSRSRLRHRRRKRGQGPALLDVGCKKAKQLPHLLALHHQRSSLPPARYATLGSVGRRRVRVLHRTPLPQRPKPRRQSILHNHQRRRSRSRDHRRPSGRSRRCIRARPHRRRLQEEVQDGSAQHERTNLQRPSKENVRIHREELSQVGDAMEIMSFLITTPTLFSAPTNALPSTTAFPTKTPRTSG